MTMASTVTAEVVETCSVVVRHSGAAASKGADYGRASARVAILRHVRTGAMMVLMTDGHFGASITNSAEEIVGYVVANILNPCGVGAGQVRWVYRDSTGAWDEMLPSKDAKASIRFVPLGMRTMHDVRAALAGAGLQLSEADRARVSLYLEGVF